MGHPVNAGVAEEPAVPGAPALEKGLDLLEALAAAPGGLTQKLLAARVGRSVGEIFRMLGVLERRGYIGRDGRSGEYSLTLRLFELATRFPPMDRLQKAALPVMDELAAATGLGCHLGMASGAHFLIVAKSDPDRPMGWVVRLGAVFPFAMHFVSARVLAAFQPEHRREEMARLLAEQSGTALGDVLASLLAIAADGFAMAESGTVAGLTDLSCPVLDHAGQAVAALTLPFLPQRGLPTTPGAALPRLREAAGRLSERLGAGRSSAHSDDRPSSAAGG